MASITTRVLDGFEDSRYGVDCWQELLNSGHSNTVFLTWQWLRAWWETLGDGQLLLIAAERAGQPVALAPFYTTAGMIYFLGAGESDYIDFVGHSAEPEILAAILTEARHQVPNLLGLRLHEIPDRSPTGSSLRVAASDTGFDCFDEGELPSVEIELAAQREVISDAVSRSMLKRENYCRRHGSLEILRLCDVNDIWPHLPEYYAQHLERWAAKGLPSPYTNPHRRAFLERFLDLARLTGWIRFLRIDWKDQPFAFEFAWYYRGTHYSAPWSFAVQFANQSPGHILLRQSILSALAEGIETYDLGAGDQEYKFRLPARSHTLRTWGVYPR